MLDINKREVAYFRRQQSLQEEVAQQGLTGLAIVASHELITARMERGAERILHLLQAGKSGRGPGSHVDRDVGSGRDKRRVDGYG